MKQTLMNILPVVVSLAIIALAAFIYFRFYFVYAEGIKAGELSYVVRQGIIFKTYEGKLIQQSNGKQPQEFDFSVQDEALARHLMLKGGQTVELHYKEYFSPLWWRGNSKFIVDSIAGPPPARQHSP